MLSSLRYDIYKPNIPHHVPGHNQRVRGGDSQGHACELSWEEAGFHQYRSASGVLRHAGGCRWGAVADRRQRRYGSQEEESAQGICRYSRGLHRVQPEHLGAARVQGVRGETLSYLQDFAFRTGAKILQYQVRTYQKSINSRRPVVLGLWARPCLLCP